MKPSQGVVLTLVCNSPGVGWNWKEGSLLKESGELFATQWMWQAAVVFWGATAASKLGVSHRKAFRSQAGTDHRAVMVELLLKSQSQAPSVALKPFCNLFIYLTCSSS